MKNSKRKNINRGAMALSLLIVIMVGVGIYLHTYYFTVQAGPAQPIPFSHRLHVEKKDISCFFCHVGAIKGARAGVPALETCMLCHRQVITHHPEIVKLREHYFQNEPIQWVKVEDVPDYAFFNHSVHVFRKVDCGECHGNIIQMDRVERVNEFNMGFCIECHQEQEATTDCFTCHR